METIKIFKKQEQKTSFNLYHYQKWLSQAYPNVHPIVLRYVARESERIYKKLHEFDTELDENTIVRNIIRQKDVSCDFSFDFSKNINTVKSDVIIYGKKHNWSRYSDVLITRFNNYTRNYPREVLDDSKQLLQHQYMAYQISKAISASKTHPPYPDFVNTIPIRVEYKSDILIDPGMLAGIANFASNMYHATINVSNFYALYIQLRSLDMLDVFLLSQKKIEQLLADRIFEESLSFGRLFVYSKELSKLSAFNLVKKIISQEYDSDNSLSVLLRSKKIRSVDDFYKQIPAKDADKIRKIVQLRSEPDKNCVHYNMVLQFISGRRHLREKIIDIAELNQNDNQYYCTKCAKRAFCQHHLDLSTTRRMDVISKYKSPELSTRDTYYCKYCSEKIYKNETEHIITNADFVSISRLRENMLARESMIDVYDSGLYIGISMALSCFRFGYDFNVAVLNKNIKVILYNLVYEQIVKLGIEDDGQYELITKMYSFIFALVYMRTAFMKDPKINTTAGTRKQDTEYGKFINNEVNNRFKTIANPGKTLNIIKTAVLRIKENNIGNVKISGKTDKDHIMEIVQSRQFWVLYQFFNYGNPETDLISAFPKIVKQPKPNLGNFVDSIQMPNKNISERMKNMYTHIFDRTSPFCYLNKFVENESTTVQGVPPYDPKIYNSLMAEYKTSWSDRRVRSYSGYVQLPPDNPFRACYGANYMYDADGNIIDWQPNGPDKDWTYKMANGTVIFLSKIKKNIDNTTKSKIDARNNRLGYNEPKYKIRKYEKSSSKVAAVDDGSKFDFNKKLVGMIINLNSTFTQYMITYLGRTEGHEYTSLMKGILSNVTSYIIGQNRINSYIRKLISMYYTLKLNPMSSDNTKFYEQYNIDFVKSEPAIRELPDLQISDYKKLYLERVSTWMPEKFYLWVLESLLVLAESMIKSGSVGKNFCQYYFKIIFDEDKKLSLPNEKKIMLGWSTNNDGDTEYDEAADASNKPTPLQTIDYEEDEDDINDTD